MVRIRRKVTITEAGAPLARPLVVARIRIDRPLAVVRAHFLDLDHHVRSNLYKGIRMAHQPSQVPGERRCRQEVIVAGIPQLNTFVLEEDGEGQVVKRFVLGPLRGVEWQTRFLADGEQATWAETTALATAGRLKRFILPGRKRAMHRAVEAVLGAHKFDLEEQCYQPGDGEHSAG